MGLYHSLVGPLHGHQYTPLPVASPPVGKRLTINLSIASGENVGGYQATIGFNPATLRYVESENGDYLPPGAFFVPPVVNRNRVTIGATSLTADGGSGDGTLATLTFEVLAVKKSRLILHESLLTDPDGTYLINFTTDGQVAFPSTPAIVRITPSSVLSPAVGEHLTLTANIADGQNVADYELTWHYDDTTFRYVSETKGDYIPDGGIGNGDGTLMTLTLEVIYIKDSSISLSGSLTTPNGDAFTPTFEGAEIKIPAFGDVNRDGAVNILDLVVVAVSFGQTVTEGGNPADVNEDGVVNIVDLVQVAGATRWRCCRTYRISTGTGNVHRSRYSTLAHTSAGFSTHRCDIAKRHPFFSAAFSSTNTERDGTFAELPEPVQSRNLDSVSVGKAC